MSDVVPQPSFHGMIMQGTDKLFFGHLAMYKVEAHQWQLVLQAELPSDIFEKYKAQKKKAPSKFLFLVNKNPALLSDLLKEKEYEALIYVGMANFKDPMNPLVIHESWFTLPHLG